MCDNTAQHMRLWLTSHKDFSDFLGVLPAPTGGQAAFGCRKSPMIRASYLKLAANNNFPPYFGHKNEVSSLC